jgi:hypothetical protein
MAATGSPAHLNESWNNRSVEEISAIRRNDVARKVMRKKILPYWLTQQTMKAAVITAGIVFLAAFSIGLSLANFRVSPATTILDDIAVALIASAVVVYYLFSIQMQQTYLRAKERMNLTAELNHHLRSAMVEFRNAAGIQDPAERLQMLDQVIEEVDHVLINLVPTVSGERGPRIDSFRAQ